MMDDLATLETMLLSAGIPVTAVRRINGGISLEYAPGATVQQVAQGEQLAADYDAGTTPAQLDAAALSAAQVVALQQAKVYLRNQLRSPAPNVATIVATVKAYINGNVVLNQMLSNQIALMNGAFGWSIDLNPATAQARQRYLLAVEAVVALLG